MSSPGRLFATDYVLEFVMKRQMLLAVGCWCSDCLSVSSCSLKQACDSGTWQFWDFFTLKLMLAPRDRLWIRRVYCDVDRGSGFTGWRLGQQRRDPMSPFCDARVLEPKAEAGS